MSIVYYNYVSKWIPTFLIFMDKKLYKKVDKDYMMPFR